MHFDKKTFKYLINKKNGFRIKIIMKIFAVSNWFEKNE